MKIVLACFAGMSTSMLVAKMEKVAKQRELDVEIIALPTTLVEEELDGTDVILIGPQARYALNNMKELGAEKNIPVGVIDPLLYGTMNGEAVLDLALNLIDK